MRFVINSYQFNTGGGGAFPAGTFADGNDISDWSYRVKVTIPASSVTSDLTNFLWMIDLSDLSSTSFFSAVRSDGGDIRITKSDETTELANYNSQIDTGSSTGIHWARIDGTLSSSSDNEFYIYYGNATATAYATTATYGRNNTFQDFEAIYDFEQDPSGTASQLTDLTGNGNDGTSNGSMTAGDEVTGKVGNAWDFEGTDDYVDLGFNVTSYSSITLGGWAKADSFNDFSPMIGTFSSGTDNGILLRYNINLSNKFQFNNKFDGGTSQKFVVSNSTPSTATWYHLIGVIDSSGNMKMVLNGVEQTDTETGAADFDNHTENIKVAHSGFADTRQWWDGLIGPQYVINGTRSSDYLTTEYDNQNSPSTFYSVGTEETP